MGKPVERQGRKAIGPSEMGGSLVAEREVFLCANSLRASDDKGKPAERQGRKAMGLKQTKIARLQKH